MNQREQFEAWLADDMHRAGLPLETAKRRAADSQGRDWSAWRASRQQAIEECALVCDGQLDGAKEAESLMKFNFARNTVASEEEQVRAGEFWNDVHTLNAVLLRAAKAIRSLGEAS